MTRQSIDIGDLVECYLGKGEERITGVVVERKAINPADGEKVTRGAPIARDRKVDFETQNNQI